MTDDKLRRLREWACAQLLAALDEQEKPKYTVKRVYDVFVVLNKDNDEIASFEQEKAANEYAALRNKHNG